MDNFGYDFAKVGDTIEIIREGIYYGKHFVVVPAPENSERIAVDGDVYVCNEFGLQRIVKFWEYEVVRRSKAQEPRSVDDFLRKQLNDNMRDMFG